MRRDLNQMRPFTAAVLTFLLISCQSAAPLCRTGSLTGTVRYDGDPPKPEYRWLPGDRWIRDETLLIDSGKGIANVLVLLEGPDTAKWTCTRASMSLLESEVRPQIVFVSPGGMVDFKNELAHKDPRFAGGIEPDSRNQKPWIRVDPGTSVVLTFLQPEIVRLDWD